MRKPIVLVALMMALVLPAEAQFREAVPYPTRPPARLYEATGKVGTFLSKIFSPAVFNMSHSVEMSAGSFGGQGFSMGMYTNTMSWQFSDKLAARMDVAVAYSPQNQFAQRAGFVQHRPQVFLRNAEVAWRPSKNVRLNLQVRNNPYGYNRMGYDLYGPYGFGSYGYARHHMDRYWQGSWY